MTNYSRDYMKIKNSENTQENRTNIHTIYLYLYCKRKYYAKNENNFTLDKYYF